jgi:hypothetical protein
MFVGKLITMSFYYLLISLYLDTFFAFLASSLLLPFLTLDILPASYFLGYLFSSINPEDIILKFLSDLCCAVGEGPKRCFGSSLYFYNFIAGLEYLLADCIFSCEYFYLE